MKRRYTLYLEEKFVNELKKEAKKENRSVSYAINELLKKRFDK